MEKLPAELIINILDYSQLDEIIKLNSLNKCFRTITDYYIENKWKRFNLRINPENKTRFALAHEQKVCINCKAKCTKIFDLLQNYICEKCKSNTECIWGIISKTAACKKYFIDVKELLNLPKVLIRGRYSVGTYHLVFDVQEVVKSHYGSLEKFEEFLVQKELEKQRKLQRKEELKETRKLKMIKLLGENYLGDYAIIEQSISEYISGGKGLLKIKERAKRIDDTKELLSGTIPEILEEYYSFYINHGGHKGLERLEKMIDRKNELCSRLSEHNLSYRDDSVLCRQFLMRGRDIDNVVSVLVEMNWFSKRTDYFSKIKNKLKNNSARMHPESVKEELKKDLFLKFKSNHLDEIYPESLKRFLD